MRPFRFELDGHRSVDQVVFEAGAFTVLFGKNNAGKTNILEAIYGLLADEVLPWRRPAVSRDTDLHGGLWVDLEPGLEFDQTVASALGLDLREPGPQWARIGRRELARGTPFGWREAEPETLDDALWEGRRELGVAGPRPHVLLLDWQFENLHEPFSACVAQLAADEAQVRRRQWPWLETAESVDGVFTYRVPERVEEVVAALASLATDLLPDFVEGEIRAHVTSPTMWHEVPKVLLEFHERGATQCADVVELAGSGAARWMAAATQIASHLMRDNPSVGAMRHAGLQAFSGHVLLLDEPEAHLHPSAVASIVRWCHRMVRHGMVVVVASHHEEFLRASGDGVTLVHVTRNEDLVGTTARTLTSTATHALQELATDIGMHPAAALSLHRAILFVEGTLDVAVLDEFAGVRLDAAGVMLVPVHGTKNLEGLVSAEVVARLGLRVGVLTDATDAPTMADRSRKHLSSEEKKVLRVVELARESGLPTPTVFGVVEEDLLFALPREGIERYLGRPFPDWKELVRDARREAGASPSESVNWKRFALERHGLPITDPSGVREVVRHLDLEGVDMPSLTKVVDEVVAWAGQLSHLSGEVLERRPEGERE